VDLYALHKIARTFDICMKDDAVRYLSLTFHGPILHFNTFDAIDEFANYIIKGEQAV
jgi:hypothetical protein